MDESRVDSLLEGVGVSLLSEWDALVFLYRHGVSLAGAGQIAKLLGYNRNVVGRALDRLVLLGLVHRSRSSQGSRFYRFAVPASGAVEQSLEELINLSQTRSGRLMVVNRFRERARRSSSQERDGLHLA